MIIKYFDFSKVNFEKYELFLLYGANQGQKSEIINKILNKVSKNIQKFDESEIINNKEVFFNTIYNKSFFEDDKTIIISRVSDKFKDIIDELLEKDLSDTRLILVADMLDKKSKLRNFFEKDKKTICVPVYQDNAQTLTNLASNFFKENKIGISQQSINIIVSRSSGDRKYMKNELDKIKNFLAKRNKVEYEEILKLINLSENISISELIDNCLAKNTSKTINILNENNQSLDDSILIIKTFLNKTKRLFKLFKIIENENSIEGAIASFKPPIFWKEKELVKQQLKKWSLKKIENLIYEVNHVELLIKKNSMNSVNILNNFIIEKSKIVNN